MCKTKRPQRTSTNPNHLIRVSAPRTFASGLIELLGEPLTREDREDELAGADLSESVLTWPYSRAGANAVESCCDGSGRIQIEMVDGAGPARTPPTAQKRGVRSDDSLIFVDLAYQDAGTHDDRGRLRGGPTRRTGSEALTWREFVETLTRAALDQSLAERCDEYAGRHARRHLPGFRPSNRVKYGPGFCHGVRNPKTKKITEVWALVVDIDGLPEAGLQVALTHLRGIGSGIWQATTSDSRESRRVRVVMPYSEFISPGRHRRLAKHLLDGLCQALAEAGFDPGAVDRSSVSPSQQWLFGRRPDGGSVPCELGGDTNLSPRKVRIPKSANREPQRRRRNGVLDADTEIRFAEGHAIRVGDIDDSTISRAGEKCYDPRRPHDPSPGCVAFPKGIYVHSTAEYLRFSDALQDNCDDEPARAEKPSWLRESRSGSLGADAHIVIDQRYVPSDVGEWADVLALLSPCGSGKTEAIKALDGRVLIVIPRISLRRELAERLSGEAGHDPIVELLDDNNLSRKATVATTPDGKYTICCPESLLAVEGDFDRIVIEECEMVFPQICGRTCGVKGPNILRRLTELCADAKVLISDAHLSGDSIATLREIAGARKLTLVENIVEHGRVLTLHESLETVRSELERWLAGEAEGVPELMRGVGLASPRLLVGCASKELAKTLARDIRDRHPDLVVRLVTGSESKCDLHNPTTLDTGDHDVLITTSAVSVGVDMASEEWDAVFLFGGHHLSVREQLQMVVRARNPWSRNVHAHVPKHRSSRPWDPEIIDERIRQAHKETVAELSRVLGQDELVSYYVRADRGGIEILDDEYHRLAVRTLAARRRELQDYRRAFETTAVSYAWTVVEGGSPRKKKVSALADAREAQRSDHVEALAMAEPIDPIDQMLVAELEAAEASSSMTVSQQLRLERHRIECVLGQEALERVEVQEALVAQPKLVDEARALAQQLALAKTEGVAGLAVSDAQRVTGPTPQQCRHLLRRAQARTKLLRAWGLHDLAEPSSWTTDGHASSPGLVEPGLDVIDILGVRTREQAGELLGIGIGERSGPGLILATLLGRMGLRRVQVRAVRGARYYGLDRERLRLMLDLAAHHLRQIHESGADALTACGQNFVAEADVNDALDEICRGATVPLTNPSPGACTPTT